MQAIYKIPLRFHNDDTESQYAPYKLNVRLKCGAKVICVTPILDEYCRTSVTSALSYVIEEPDTEEYKKAIEEELSDIDNRISHLKRSRRW